MIEVKHSIFDFNKDEWNSCVPNHHPFLRYEFYQALEESQCLGAAIGWLPFYLASYENNQLKAILPTYLKSHSYGEYIFDWSWAQAYEKYGIPYYPKLTLALPHTPVSAPKWISKKEDFDIHPYLQQLEILTKDYRCSSTHFLFTSTREAIKLEQAHFARRLSLQYHWHNRNYQSFDDFLSTLRKDKRKNFKKERQAIKDSDIEIVEKHGQDIGIQDAQFMAQVYLSTIEKKWSQAYLNQHFFERWFDLLRDQMLFIIAYEAGQPIAAAIHLKSDDTLFGRYWGAVKDVPFLHFELCYYRAIDFAIEHKLKTVEAGAQGEHKLLRGFEPTLITSHHKIEYHGFDRAIREYIHQESEQIELMKSELEKTLLPYKRT